MTTIKLTHDFTIPSGTPGTILPRYTRTTSEKTVSILVATSKDTTAELTMFLSDAIKLGLVEVVDVHPNLDNERGN